MSHDPQKLDDARRVSRTHARELLAKANVVGVGVGSAASGDLTLVVMVSHKFTREQLAASDLVPNEIEGIPVEVRVVGELKAQAAGPEPTGPGAKGGSNEAD